MGSIYYHPSFSLIRSPAHRCLAPLVSLSYPGPLLLPTSSQTCFVLQNDPYSLQGSPLSLDCGLS